MSNPIARAAQVLLVKAVVAQVRQQIMQQISRMETEIRSEVNKFLQQVIDGCWTGPGAERFKAEVSEFVLPNLDAIRDELQQTDDSVNCAVEVMDEADMAIRQIVDNLVATFEAI